VDDQGTDVQTVRTNPTGKRSPTVASSGVLGDRPAVLAWQVQKQPAHKRPGPLPQIHPTKPACDPAQ
jgi:hypothetical protein